MHYFSNLFWYRTLHVLGSFTVHHQETSTVYTAISIRHTGYANRLDHDQQRCYRHAPTVKPEAANAVVSS